MPKQKFRKERKSNAFVILSLTLLLCLTGLIFVYSASNYTAEKDYDNAFYFVKKQFVGYVLGTIAFFVSSKLDCEFLKRNSILILIVSFILLGLVLTPLGKEVYGAKRWIGIGGFSIQPSEISKFAFVLFTSAYLSKDISKVKTFKGCLPVFCAGGITCLLIILEPNMSVTVCIGVVMFAMLFIAGMPIKKILLIFLPILALLPVMIIIEPYRLKRLTAFLDPWSSTKGEGYQLLQSLYALGSGGLFGVGLFNSRQKLKFLPFSESDFILSIIGEETGFFGITVLLIVCLLLAYQIIKTAIESQNFFEYLMCFGIACVFLVQIMVNVLVVTGSIPPTGIPFPLISSGNTQIIVFMSTFGLVSGISEKNAKNKLPNKRISYGV